MRFLVIFEREDIKLGSLVSILFVFTVIMR